MRIEDVLAECTGFEWDDHNLGKNWKAHRVAFWECEELFLNEPLIVAGAEKHPSREKRYYVLGYTNGSRLLFVVFTIRRKLIRVISARDMTRKEKKLYESHEE